jgi:putative tryptophan/tyrosine transport system substrate-binding protein
LYKRKCLVLGLLMLLLPALVLGGCAQLQPQPEPAPEPADTEPAPEVEHFFKIGILQLSEHPALDDARMGTMDALANKGFVEGYNVSFDYKNAQGEPATAESISQGFVADNVDLIIAITMPAVQAAASATGDIPIVFNSGTDPQAYGLIESWEQPNTNVTGVSDLSPVKETLKLILEIQRETKTVGVIYNTNELNSARQVDIARNLAPDLGLEIVESTVTHTGEVGTAAEALVGKVDAIFLPTDNTAITAFHAILGVTKENNLLVIGSTAEFAELGAVAAVGFVYYDLGYQSGIMAAEVLRGANPAEMPIQLPTRVFYAINERAAANMGIELPQNLVKRAELKY